MRFSSRWPSIVSRNLPKFVLVLCVPEAAHRICKATLLVDRNAHRLLRVALCMHHYTHPGHLPQQQWTTPMLGSPQQCWLLGPVDRIWPDMHSASNGCVRLSVEPLTLDCQRPVVFAVRRIASEHIIPKPFKSADDVEISCGPTPSVSSSWIGVPSPSRHTGQSPILPRRRLRFPVIRKGTYVHFKFE